MPNPTWRSQVRQPTRIPQQMQHPQMHRRRRERPLVKADSRHFWERRWAFQQRHRQMQTVVEMATANKHPCLAIPSPGFLRPRAPVAAATAFRRLKPTMAEKAGKGAALQKTAAVMKGHKVSPLLTAVMGCRPRGFLLVHPDKAAKAKDMV